MSKRPSEIIFAVEETPEGGFVARALGHSVFTEADDLEALRAAVRAAVSTMPTGLKWSDSTS
jgi:hypothetical protein